MKNYARVIIQFAKVEAIDKLFTYKIPESLKAQIQVGMRVKVPFGKSSQKQLAYVLEVCEQDPDQGRYRLKNIHSVVDHTPILSEEQLEMAKFLVTYYGASWASSLNGILPPGIKDEILEYKPQKIKYVIRKASLKVIQNYLLEIEGKVKFTKQTKALVPFLECTKKPLSEMPVSKNIIQTLCKKDLLDIEEHIEEEAFDVINHSAFKVLSSEQNMAYQSIKTAIETKAKETFLLEGVTGSGKTEVFLYAIKDILNQGRSAIILVPEIALTSQTLNRFKERFGNRVALTHSRMTPKERQQIYMRAKEGKIQVVIGPRSAVFMPFKNLGLIVIDEEHEATYKSETAPKYHAADLARWRMNYHKGTVILASATPRLESYYESRNHKIKLLKLTQRVAGATLPDVELVDMRKELKNGNTSVISTKLFESIKQTLEQNGQVMLLLNRRGHSTFISCRNCGYVVMCPHCECAMTYHLTKNQLACHYCNTQAKVPEVCPECGSSHIRFFGNGTQKVESYLKTHFNDYGVCRMDTDTTGGKLGHEKVLEAFRNRAFNILIGTQMIAKGHDFPNVTLVGVIAADLSLYMEDFRSEERTYQLLTQTLGRSGRGMQKGKVLIQTYNPENNVLQAVLHGKQEAFYDNQIGHRDLLGYPPFGHVVFFVLSGKDEKSVIQKSHLFSQYLHHYNRKKLFRVIGPNMAALSKIADHYRWQVMVIGESREVLMMYTKYCIEKFSKRESLDLVKLSWDIDPLTIL